MTECLDVKPEHVWGKMREIAESIRDNQLTAVKAGHSVSKTYTAARIALWFLYCYGPMATVITTAPTEKQVSEVLWRDINLAHSQARIPLGGDISTKKLNLDSKWFALGFSTRPDTVTQEATAFQGYHNEYVLVIFDEAAGILSKIWEAALNGLVTNERCKMLVIGNPTSAYGEFTSCFKPDSGFNQITVSVKDTPNFQQGKEIIPSVSGRKYEQGIRKKYGEDSNTYKSRVLGMIPETTEGAVYGKEFSKARRDGRICKLPEQPHALVHTAWDLGAANTDIWFFQMVGKEIHIIDHFLQLGPGLGFADYVRLFDQKKIDNNWVYGRHFAPHDIAQHEMATGNTRKESAREAGIDFEMVPKLSIADGIESVRMIFPRCWFNEETCDDGLKGLAEYQWKKIETLSRDDKPAYGAHPEHDWASHPADGFRYLAVAVEQGMIQSIVNDTSHDDWSNYYQSTG